VDLSRFEGITVLDTEGRETAFSAPLQGRLAVVIFVRHFG